MESQVIQVELPASLVDELKKLATKHNEQPADTLARAIATLKLLDEEQARGSRLLIDHNGKYEAIRPFS